MKIIVSSDVTFDNSKIAKNIAEERRKAGYSSIIEAAKALGVSTPTLAKYEKDPGNASFTFLQKMADLYGCLLEDFFMA